MLIIELILYLKQKEKMIKAKNEKQCLDFIEYEMHKHNEENRETIRFDQWIEEFIGKVKFGYLIKECLDCEKGYKLEKVD